MTLLHRLASIVRWVAGRTRAEQEMDDELRGFVEMSAAEKMRAGWPGARGRSASGWRSALSVSASSDRC